MPRLTKADAALRNVIFGKSPLKTKLGALAGMESPSETFLIELVSSPETHSKVKTKAVDRLAQVRHKREVDRILAEEISRLAKIGDPKKTSIAPPVQSPMPAIPQPEQRPENGQADPLAEWKKTEALVGSAKPLTVVGNPMSQEATSAPVAPPIRAGAVASVTAPEGERERRRYHAIFSGRFRSGQLNPCADPILRQQCNSDDLAAIDGAFSEARRKIQSGKNFDNFDCGQERAVLCDWISTPGKGVDGLGRLTFEGKIASTLWDELEALAKTIKNLPAIGD